MLKSPFLLFCIFLLFLFNILSLLLYLTLESSHSQYIFIYIHNTIKVLLIYILSFYIIGDILYHRFDKFLVYFQIYLIDPILQIFPRLVVSKFNSPLWFYKFKKKNSLYAYFKKNHLYLINFLYFLCPLSHGFSIMNFS